MTEKHEHLEKHKKLHEKAEKLIDTTEHEGRKVYDTAVESVLRDKDSNLIDYKKLEETEHQLKFADKMADGYLKSAKEALGADPKDEFENELLRKAYHGVTKSELRGYVADHKKDFKFDTFKNLMDKKFLPAIKQTLYSTAGQHLTEDHVEDIIKYTGLADIEDFVPDYLTRDGAITILDQYHNKGEKLTRYDVESIIRELGAQASRSGQTSPLPEQLLKKKKKEKKK